MEGSRFLGAQLYRVANGRLPGMVQDVPIAEQRLIQFLEMRRKG